MSHKQVLFTEYIKPSNYVDDTNANRRPQKCVKNMYNKKQKGKEMTRGLINMKKLKMSNIIIKVVLVQLKQFSTEESSMKHK